MDSHPFEQYHKELEIEGELYRRLSHTSKKVDDIFGATEERYVKRGYLTYLESLLQREMEGGAGLDHELAGEIAREREHAEQHTPEELVSSLPETIVTALQNRRVSLIRAAIRDGSVVPSWVIAQYPKGFFAEDFATLTRYMKACHTVFTNRHGRIDESLLVDYGCKLRRQDGRAIGEHEKDEIRTGLDEIFSAVGDLSPLMRATGLTIVHTGGRRIFRYPHTTCGVFQSMDQTITLGINGTTGRPNLTSLAHELVGHWLDTVSTPPQSWLDAIFGESNPYLRKALHTSFIDAALQGDHSLYPQLILHMILPPDECPPAQRPAHSSSELWARLAEQHVALSLRCSDGDDRVSVCPPESYFRTVGYWQRDSWGEGLGEIAREQVRARIWMAERIYGIRRSPHGGLPKFFLRQFPWAENLSKLSRLS